MKERDFRQRLIQDWLHRAFDSVLTDPAAPLERARRVLEEAIELYQSVGGSAGDIEYFVQRCYSRPVGKPEQEAGQVGITLLAFGSSLQMSIDMLERMELERIMNLKSSFFTERMAKKILYHPPFYSDLDVSRATAYLQGK